MILSKYQLVENIVTELSDNSTGQISPHDIRHNLLDIIDSVHLLTGEHNLKARNFSTPETRTTRVGEFTIANLELEGYSSLDNSAFGFEALKSNYQGSKNTALGSKSLSCNVYGENNVAVGYLSLSSNSTGIGNVGVGNYSLSNNRVGNFNIGIGNAAGYYIDRDANYKLYIASHPVDEEYLCDNPSGSGLIPLVHADLSGIKFGIGVNSLHDNAALQVGGNANPSSGNAYNLGSNEYSWKHIFLSSSIVHPSGNVGISLNDKNCAISGNLVPFNNSQQAFGEPSKQWASGYFKDIIVSNTATISILNAVETCFYPCKTIYLAASGCNNNLDFCNYLDDDSLLGAGFNLYSDNGGTLRKYTFDFSPPASGSSFENNLFAKARWNSNISLALSTGVYLISNRVISHFNDGHGLYFNSGVSFVCNNNAFTNRSSIGGSGNFNLISSSGNSNPYFSSIIALESGVTIGTRFITGAKSKVLDPSNSNREKLRGFDLKYIDDSLLNIVGQKTSRLIIGSYDNTSYNQNVVSILQNGGDAILGINNLAQISQNAIPKTAIDIRSTGNAIIRATAENQSQTIAAVQLLGEEDCLYKGFETAYLNTSGIADLSMYKDSGRSVFIRLYDNNRIGIFTASGTANEMFTLGDNFNNKPAVSLYEASGTFTSSSKYAKLYAKPKIVASQSSTVYLLDSSGNIHDLVVNKLDNTDGRALYCDNSANTFGGIYSTKNRSTINVNSKNNTSLGYGSFYNGSDGGYENTIVGAYCGSGITTGYRNSIVGYRSASSLSTGHNNIVIGNNAFNNTSLSVNNNIVIGNSGLADATSGDYQFWLGANKNLVLLQGTLGPNNASKILTMPSGGHLRVYNSNNSEAIGIRNNVIEVLDYGGSDYPENELYFAFTGNKTKNILKLNHNAEPITTVPTYSQPNTSVPYAELSADFRILGAIRFSDNTSLSSASQITINKNNIEVLTSGINNLSQGLSSLLVEGYCPLKISAPINAANPTVGSLVIKNSVWADAGSVTLVNRDLNLNIPQGAYVIALKINNEYRPLWINSQEDCNVCCQ